MGIKDLQRIVLTSESDISESAAVTRLVNECPESFYKWNDKQHHSNNGEAPEVTTFICNYCNRDLIKLSDSSGKNVSWYCNNCSIPFEPENETIRHKQKLEVPDRNVEPAISTTPGIPDVSISHTIPIRGGFAELQKKGLRIKDYHTTEKE